MKFNSCDVELPYKVIHLLVCTVQNILEKALFDFARKWTPKLLEMARWEIPEQGELNSWEKLLDQYVGDIIFAFRAKDVASSYLEFTEKLHRLHHLRHSAVHRIPIGVAWLRRWMIDAVDMTQCLAMCLEDNHHYNKLRIIELGVWRPDLVNLEETAAKPLDHFMNGDNVPDRKEFLDPVIIADVRESRGVRPGRGRHALRGHRRGPSLRVAQASNSDRRSRSPEQAGRVPNAVLMPSRPSKKRARSRTPPVITPPRPTRELRSSKRLKAWLTKETGANIMIDLTEDDEKDEGKLVREPPKTTSPLLIDLTEDD
jgi:hypothetical protein